MDNKVCLALLILVLISYVSLVDSKHDGYFRRLAGLRIRNNILTFSLFKETHCCLKCLQYGDCHSVNVHEKEGTCEINRFGPQDSGAITEVNRTWSLYYKSNAEDRELMLRATAGIEISVRDTWLGRVSPPPTQDTCIAMATGACSTHYRNPKVDLWNTLYISQVILELYRDGSRVMFMVFNGTGSDLESWVSSFRLMTSSWAMLSPSSNFIYFSLKGDQPCSRIFLIQQNYGGCPKDAGWFVVLDPTTSDCCLGQWSDLPNKPKFVYSTTDNVAIYQSGDVDYADVLAVFVKYSDH
ncbi:uncharacterized protein LOC125659728 [Ostrea edulis]|uniref:uncharacterized protein LOC125659728 n=1 Tax=Ostrea edulis TaxID=37623 RepID=UPI0024AEF108|nr:uncharacterized protein LOC125659728 [Ostrea edulis]